MSAGILLKRLPPIDPRGPQERDALARALVDQAWRWRLDPHWLREKLPKIGRNVIRFGGATKNY